LPHFQNLFLQETLFHRLIMAVHWITCLVRSGSHMDGDDEMFTIMGFTMEELDSLYKGLDSNLPETELLFSVAAMIVVMVRILRRHDCVN
jgi:hypothetical protein